MNYATFDYGVEGVGGGLQPCSGGQSRRNSGRLRGYDDIDADLSKVEKIGEKSSPRVRNPGWVVWYVHRSDRNLIGLLPHASQT